MEDTQVIPDTQETRMHSLTPPAIHKELSLPPSDIRAFTASGVSTQGIDTQHLEEKLRNIMRDDSAPSDAEMLGELLVDMRPRREQINSFLIDMETQAPPQEPFTAPSTRASSDRQRQLASKKTKASVREGVSRGVDEGKLDCDCGTTVGVVGLLRCLRETRFR